MINQNQLLGLAGVGLAAMLAHVAFTGKVSPVSRAVVAAAAVATGLQAYRNFTGSASL